MKLGIKRALVGGLAVLGTLGLFATQAVPAGATVNAGVVFVQGTGTINPGLSGSSAHQTFTFTSTTICGVGVVNKNPVVTLPGTPPPVGTPCTPVAGPGPSNCTATGSSDIRNPIDNTIITSVNENAVAGAGSGTYNCTTGALAGKSGRLTYVRVGPVVIVVLTDTPPPGDNGVLVCVFVPGTLPPGTVTNYTLTCVGALAGVK